MINVPEHIKSLKPYIPGKPVEELERELGISGSVKLASNENPSGPSPLAIKAIRKGLHSLNRYPDGSCYHLKTVLSEKLRVKPAELIFGNGSNEIIELAARTFLTPGDEAIMAAPSFVVYPSVSQAAGGKNITVPLRDWRHDLEAMASGITDRTRIIFIANPNNPTGTINTKNEMDAFINRVPDNILVILDEAYFEYVMSGDYPDSIKYLRNGKNVLILRTFSKIYGLSALRIGYGISSHEIISEMNKVRQPFNVNSLAQTAAAAALKDKAHIEKTLRINESGKNYLYRELRKLKIHFVPTEANFIYILFNKETAQDIYSSLLNEGVIVRPVGPCELRVTIGLQKENRKFMEKLKKVLRNFPA